MFNNNTIDFKVSSTSSFKPKPLNIQFSKAGVKQEKKGGKMEEPRKDMFSNNQKENIIQLFNQFEKESRKKNRQTEEQKRNRQNDEQIRPEQEDRRAKSTHVTSHNIKEQAHKLTGTALEKQNQYEEINNELKRKSEKAQELFQNLEHLISNKKGTGSVNELEFSTAMQKYHEVFYKDTQELQESIESQKRQLQNDYKLLQSQFEHKIDRFQKQTYALQFQNDKLQQENRSLQKKLQEEQEINYQVRQTLVNKEEELINKTKELQAQVMKLESGEDRNKMVEEIYRSKQKVIAQIEEHKAEKEMYKQMAQERERINQEQNKELMQMVQSRNALEQRVRQQAGQQEQDAQLAELMNWNQTLKDKIETLLNTMQEMDQRLSGLSNVEQVYQNLVDNLFSQKVEPQKSQESSVSQKKEKNDLLVAMQGMMAQKEEQVGQLMDQLQVKQQEIVDQQDHHFMALQEKDKQMEQLKQEIQDLKQDYVDLKRQQKEEQPKGNLKRRSYISAEPSTEESIKSPKKEARPERKDNFVFNSLTMGMCNDCGMALSKKDEPINCKDCVMYIHQRCYKPNVQKSINRDQCYNCYENLKGKIGDI